MWKTDLPFGPVCTCCYLPIVLTETPSGVDSKPVITTWGFKDLRSMLV